MPSRHFVHARLLLAAVFGTALLPGCGVPFEADIRVAQRKATDRRRDLFVYYKSWLSPECGVMQNELTRSQVQHQLSDMVCCILDEAFRPNREFVGRYGIQNYPAMLVVRTDGSHQTRQGALRADEIASFLAEARGGPHSAAAATAPADDVRQEAPAPPAGQAVRWHADFQSAYDEAQRENKRLFIFYDSEVGGDNGTLAASLEQPDMAGLLADTVNCRLNWSEPANRARMAYYDVTLVPGFVALRPDGRYESRQGPLTPEELLDFVRQALP
jgi:hypothetical protein